MANKVVIYTTSECAYCEMTKEFFRQNKISYEEKDVSVDDKAREEMVAKSGQLGAPVVDIDDEIVIGFDEGKLAELLSIK